MVRSLAYAVHLGVRRRVIVDSHAIRSLGDDFLKNSYYIRCGNITLGYTLPLKKKFLQSCRIYADINNPFIITNWTGLDPETDNGTYAYPNITSYSLGINIKF